MEKLLELLEQDCTMPVEALAAAAGVILVRLFRRMAEEGTPLRRRPGKN